MCLWLTAPLRAFDGPRRPLRTRSTGSAFSRCAPHGHEKDCLASFSSQVSLVELKGELKDAQNALSKDFDVLQGPWLVNFNAWQLDAPFPLRCLPVSQSPGL